MFRAARCIGLLLLLAPAGCTRDEDYLDVFREQQAAYKEMADILATVKDQQSMADAKSAFEQRRARFEAIAKKGKALPNPPPPDVVKRMKEEEFAVKRTMTYLQTELDRVSRLEGGKEFLQQFKSGSASLFPAVP
jgi:hypothetical protein